MFHKDLGNLHKKIGNHDLAIYSYGNAVRTAPNRSFLFNYICIIRLQQEDEVVNTPIDERLVHAFLWFLVGEAYQKKDEYEQAVNVYEEAIDCYQRALGKAQNGLDWNYYRDRREYGNVLGDAYFVERQL